MNNISHAGRRGSDVRSDCWIELELKESGSIQIVLTSKVESLYGTSIRELIKSVLSFYNIDHAQITIEDFGALPFVIAARVEAAIKRLHPNEQREFLFPMKEHCLYETMRERLRRSRLYLPGNESKFFLNAGLHYPDGIILDLEDSVSPSVKDEARILVRNALREINFYGAERMVRINQLPLGYEDLEAIIPHSVHVVLIPKCESAQQVIDVNKKIDSIKKQHNIDNEIFLMPIIESALGAIKSFEIASSAKNIIALAIGLEDYTADIGTQRTLEGRESFWMRSQIVNAARATGVQPTDTVFSDVNDMEGLRLSVLEAKSLGFDGKGCIHPRQIQVIHDAFAPDEKEIDRAIKIVLAFDKAEAQGLGVVSLGSKMIDPPVVKRALHTIDLAIKSKRLKNNWKEEMIND